MKILLCNDDGVFAAGIRALAEALIDGNEVFVSAPDTERSAVSRSMTLFAPLRAKAVQLSGLPDVPAYAVNGTPVDCVRLGIGNLFPEPDLVVSGINLGRNLGTDVLYSGTVGAAHEAALLGYQSIAISSCAFQPQHLETAGAAARWSIAYLQKHPMPFGTVFNVNVPDLPLAEIKGVRAAATGIVSYTLKFEERKDPAGIPYYWPPRGRVSDAEQRETDEHYLRDGYISVTPLGYDLTDRALLAGLDVSGIKL